MHDQRTSLDTTLGAKTKVRLAQAADLFVGQGWAEVDWIKVLVQTRVKSCTGDMDILIRYCRPLESASLLRATAPWLVNLEIDEEASERAQPKR